MKLNEATMTHKEALKILGATGNETTPEMSKLFKRASLRAHPDRGGSTTEMQKINQAYDVVTRVGATGGPRSETTGDIRARYAAEKKAYQEKLEAYMILCKNYFSTKFNAAEFAEYFTKYTGQPTTFKMELVKGKLGVNAHFEFKSSDAIFEFSFHCQPPREGNGLAAPDSSSLGDVSVSTFVMVGTKKHKMASREYQWGKNPDKITPESLFPGLKLKNIFSPAKKTAKYKRADYMAAFQRHLNAEVSGNNIEIPVGDLKVLMFRTTMLNTGMYNLNGIVDPAVSKYRSAVSVSGSMVEDDEGACLDMILDTFKELQKYKPDAAHLKLALEKMKSEFLAGHRSVSFVKRMAVNNDAPEAAPKKERAKRIGKEEYMSAIKQVGASGSGTYWQFDTGAGLVIQFKRTVHERKGWWTFSNIQYKSEMGLSSEWLKGIEVAEDKDGASIHLITDTLKQLRGVADWYTAGKVLKEMAENFRAGKFVAPKVAKQAEQKIQKKELGAQPTTTVSKKPSAPATDLLASRDKEVRTKHLAISKMVAGLLKAGRANTVEEIDKLVQESISLYTI